MCWRPVLQSTLKGRIAQIFKLKCFSWVQLPRPVQRCCTLCSSVCSPPRYLLSLIHSKILLNSVKFKFNFACVISNFVIFRLFSKFLPSKIAYGNGPYPIPCAYEVKGKWTPFIQIFKRNLAILLVILSVSCAADYADNRSILYRYVNRITNLI